MYSWAFQEILPLKMTNKPYIRNVNPIGVVQKKQIMVHLHTMNMMF